MSIKNIANFIWKFVRLQKWPFLLLFVIQLVWSLDQTLMPYLLGQVVDIFGQFDGNRENVWSVLKWVLISAISLWVFVECGCRYRNFLAARALPQLESDIRMAMFDHIQHHSPKYFNEHFAGSLANKISDMTTQVTQIFHQVSTLLAAIVTSLVSMIVFYQVNPLFAIILGCWIVIHYGICLAFTPKCAKYSDIHGEARSTLAGKIVDSLTNNFTVNLFSRFRFEKSRIFHYQKDEQEKNRLAQLYVAKMFVCLSATFIVGMVLLNGFLIFTWIKGKITTGEVIQIFNTLWNVLFMLWISGEIIPQFFQSIGIANQALSVMHDPQDILDHPSSTPLVVKKGEIIFENVSFQYGEKRIFNNKHVHIKGGEKVGLVGYSGAGKSTFVNLILRFYPVDQGRILIDGQNIAHVTLESLRKQVALIPQDPLLFHRTLEENIGYGRLDATREEIVEMAKTAHCDEFIQKCPESYQTLVGERGTKLSGGERQRIAIARAMLTEAPILLLDEATSSLDSVTEQYIQDSLEKLMNNRTTIVIAHRLSTLSKMDRILVFDKGEVIEEGSHGELLDKNGHYAHLWHMQAGGFLPEKPVEVMV